MTLINRFSAIDKAIINATGNSLVICGNSTTIDDNTSDMITVAGGTTRNWAASGSNGTISILGDSTILYAELIWYSTVKSDVPGSLDVRSIQDNPITFTTPLGVNQISPQNTESYTDVSGNIDRFRSTDITNIIKASLGGTYTVSAVPTSLPAVGLSSTRAGWTLTVIYRNDVFVPKKIIFLSGIEPATNSNPFQTTITGFATSSDENDLKGNIIFACANGQPLKGVETLKTGPSFANLTVEGNPVGAPNPNPGTSPNNPYNSFFPGQINICNPIDANVGLINISGTNGTKNHDGFVPTQVTGGRNKWDLTNINFSNSLVTNQNQLAIQLTESGAIDGVMIVESGTSVNAVAPDIVVDFNIYDPDGKSASKVQVGEQLIYSVKVSNSGKSAANNFILSTILDPACSYIPNSFTVNGVVSPGADIAKGVNIGTIEPTGVANVLFSVRVNSLPVSKTIKGYVDYNYSFVSGSGSPTTTNYGTSKVITIDVITATISVVKISSAQTALVGDRINYTIDIKNTGTVPVTSVLFQDVISKYSSFVTGTVSIDGKSDPSLDPNIGFSLSDLPVSGSIRIIFSVDILSLPPSTIVDNSTKVTFTTINPAFPFPITRTILSNILPIQIQFTDIVAKRCTSNDYPKVGEIVTYNLNLTNIGNITATNVNVIEPPVYGQTFVTGTVTINGVPKPTLNPFTGFVINSIPAQQSTDIQYQMLLNAVNPNKVIENTANVPFRYQVQPGSPEIDAEINSNTVTTIANFVKVDIIETVDKPYATIGDILYYSVEITNSGNIDAFNTIFLSKIQNGTSFIPGTVAINGVIQPGLNPSVGFSVGTICLGNTIVVTYQALVNSVPIPNVVLNNSELVYSYKPDPNGVSITTTATGNTVQTIINVVSFTFTKTVDKDYGVVGDFMSYSTYIVNTGTVTLRNVKFADDLSSYLRFYSETVFINGINYPGYDVRTGFIIGDLNPGDTFRISFGVSVIAVPPSGVIANTADMVYTYQLSPSGEVITDSSKSNEVRTNIVNGDLKVTKYVNKTYATLGDTLTYSFNVSNIGNVTATSTNFFDVIPIGASFIPGTVIINGLSKPIYNPELGFALGSLTAGQVVSLSFNTLVNFVPSPNTLINNGSVIFDYLFNSSAPPISKTITSNNVTTVVNVAAITFTKAVDLAFATIGDVLTYTLRATNTGTVDLNNVIFKDIIPSAAIFNANSVVIDNVSKPGLNPNIGFSIDSIPPSGIRVITFKVTVISLPTPNTIINSATLSYSYKINSSGTEITGNITSNTVTTTINNASVTNTKTVDKLYATVGDTLTYTSVIKNTGNINLINTLFTDLTRLNTTFILGSVKINDQAQANLNPNTGFTLGTIIPTQSVSVEFKVTVSSVPLTGFVTNNSLLNYDYNIDPSGIVIIGNVTSNTVTTFINLGNLTITKAANRTFARVTDVVKYNFVITNTANTVLQNMSFIDIIQTESSFNTDSVFVNGINQPLFNPNFGFLLSDIGIGQFTTIEFTVTVNSIPTSGLLLNTGSVTFSYYVDPLGTPTTKTITSNQTTVNVNDTIVSATKAVDKTLAKIGDVLAYSFILINEGNTPALNVVFTDLLNSNILFNAGSVIINGTPSPLVNPNLGFSLPDLASFGTTTVSFNATVLTRPTNNVVPNFATIDYQYRVDPLQPLIPVSITTNTVFTNIAVGEITVTKFASKVYSTVNDTIVYTLSIKNTGSVNATNMVFKDLVPGSSSFIPETVLVNGVIQNRYDPNVGFPLPDLIPNAINLVSFAIKVDSLPASGTIINTAAVTFSYKLTPIDPTVTITTNSNSVTTFINLGKLVITKSVDKAYATLENMLAYTITLQNVGSVPTSNIFFQDIIKSDTLFNSGSVVINGVSSPNLNPNTGFNLADIPQAVITTVSFTVTVKSVPLNSIIYNTANVNYSYYVDPSDPLINASDQSNTVATQINLGKLTVTKAVSLAYATPGDTLDYTVNVVNSGNVPVASVNFRDVIPTGATFVPDSVTINGVIKPGYDPFDSFTLGTINAGDSVKVGFKAIVTSVPVPSLIANTANVIFTYRINPLGPDIINQTNSNTVTTQTNLGRLTLTKSVDKTYATLNDILTYTVVIANTGDVDALNAAFLDDLQSDVTFNTGSVTINGQSYVDYDPNIGFSLGTISTLGSLIVAFKVTVTKVPTQITVLNYALVTFSYKIDPNGQDYTKSTQSNTVLTYIRFASLQLVKTVDLTYATIGNILNYTIVVTSNGNTAVNQLFFIDILSNGGTFNAGSVVVDDIPQPTFNPIVGFNLPDLVSGNTSTIKFTATITSLPVPPTITNYATANGVYKIDPTGPNYQISATSNTVSTLVNVGNISVVKSVNKLYANVLDTLTYTNTITDTGNVTASDVIFTDNLQKEVSFIKGTVRINGVVNPLLDPTIGIPLNNLGPAQVVIVEFDVKIDSLPLPPLVSNTSQVQFSYKTDPNGSTIIKTNFSNTVTTSVVLGQLTATKLVDKSIATLGDVLTFTINTINSGDAIASNVMFYDTPSVGATFNSGSVLVNNVPQLNFNPTVGFSLGDIGIGKVVNVVFTATVTSVPASSKVTNEATLTFKYLVDPKEPPFSKTTFSNITTTNIALGNLSVTKAVDKAYATIGENLTYTIVITNIGNVDATNVIFLDPTPANAVFVIGSVTVNGTPQPTYNPAAGFPLNTIKPGEIVTVVYKVQVII
ncbi:DUF11 domain-containing protein [Clostridium bowmanii]|uniref:DUF11 domain-containing protein n=1 Tax=Clostridium bowmanii TaxID=132925 RepID=UPI001C0C0876|nr:DUF11 domain-containing protein [Clostridium bowmanii]MBU3191605.1 DUF11 domain-containing protein [Clostridium bowmanii]MCA1075921.1 DUF11 domain-containing protein [Clostridium bowmanii]